VDGLSGWNLALDGDQEADEFLMAIALHVVADDRSVEGVHSCEQGGRPVPLVIMGLVPAWPLFIGRALAPPPNRAGFGRPQYLEYLMR
jgi:hypothetical protein